MHKYLLVLIIFLNTPLFAFEISKEDCSSPQKLNNKLDQIKDQIEVQAEKMSAKDIEKHLLNDDIFANWLTAIAPYMIKKEVRFSRIYDDCWVFYKDLQKVLISQRKAEIKEAAKYWKACISSRDRKISPQVQSVLKCTEKF